MNDDAGFVIMCDKSDNYSYLVPKLFEDWDSARKYIDDHAAFFIKMHSEIIDIIPLYHHTILDYAEQLHKTQR